MNKQENRMASMQITLDDDHKQTNIKIHEASIVEVGFMITQVIKWIAENEEIPENIKFATLVAVEEDVQRHMSNIGTFGPYNESFFDLYKKMTGDDHDEAKQRNWISEESFHVKGEDEDEFFEEYDEFEEGRFFSLTKALEYQEWEVRWHKNGIEKTLWKYT